MLAKRAFGVELYAFDVERFVADSHYFTIIACRGHLKLLRN